MQVRFTLDKNLHADLIWAILDRAKGGSHNKAAKLLMIENFAVNVALKRQSGDSPVTNQIDSTESDDFSSDDLSSALDALDDDFSIGG